MILLRLIIVIGFIGVLSLTGCHHKTEPLADDLNKLPTHVEGASDETIIAMQHRLEKEGVRVITIGQNYLIDIPAQKIFSNQSPRINWPSYKILNDVVCYLQQFRKIHVNINSFSSPYISSRREHALTLARAKAVADYLWSQEIDSRFIFTQGLGSDKPIGMEIKEGDNSLNSRIEITFTRVVA